MKLTVFLLTVAIMQVSAKGVSQTVTFSGKNVPLENVLQSIEKQTGFVFFYDAGAIAKAKPVTIQSKNLDLKDFLSQVLRNQSLVFTMEENAVVITNKKPSAFTIAENPPIDVYGMVQDEKGTPLIGATVSVKGTNKTITTDASGGFHFEKVPSDAVLLISFVGYLSKEFNIAGQQNFVIVLQLGESNLTEVTVSTGYWQTSKAKSTGNISKVDSKTIEKQPVLNPLQAIQGRMAGVQVTQTTGVPGGGFNVQIRGRNSLRPEGNNPLYIIDGVPFTGSSLNMLGLPIIGNGNPLSSISTNDIESIEVLKDADATAIYGSRGGNGVVLITTKKGKSGKTSVDVSARFGVGKVAHFVDMLNTQEYLEVRNEGLKNDGLIPVDPSLQPYLPDLFEWESTKYTNWQKKLLGGTAKTSDVSARVSGGNQNTQYAVGANSYTETTVFPTDFGFKRGGGYLNLTHLSENGKFRFNASANYSTNKNNLNNIDLTASAITLAPNTPDLFDNNGGINWNVNNAGFQTPIATLFQPYENTVDRLITDALLSYTFSREIELQVSMGYNNMFSEEISSTPLKSIPPVYRPFVKGYSMFGNGSLKNWIIEPKIKYVRSFGKSEVNALLGSSLQETTQNSQAVYAYGYTNDDLLKNMNAAPELYPSGSSFSQYRYGSVYARLNYAYDDKYFVNVTGRRDGSSRFGPGKQFGNFYAVGAAWIFSKENFVLDALPVLSFGKLRGSYGLTGNDQIGDYQYLNTYTPSSYPYLGSTGLIVTRLLNPDFSWETNKKLELAIELGFLKDRLFISSSWYRNRSSNQLIGLPLPVLTGQASIQYNLPATVQNTGWEFEFRSLNISNSKFRWTTDINLTIPRNKLVAFPNIDAFPSYKNSLQVGNSLYVKKVLQFNGVDPATGLYTFNDIDKDGFISSPEDALFLKEISQKLFGGMANSFSYKGIELSFLLQFVKQTGSSFERHTGAPGSFSNQPREVLNRWQKPGDNVLRQQYSVFGTVSYNNYTASDAAIVDASFIRLKNLSLSWTLPKLFGSGIKTAKIFAQAQNLFTITNYIGLDPETQSLQTLPPLRVITGGIQLTF